MRNAEDEVEVTDGKQFALTGAEPLLAGIGLTFWTVTIAAGAGDRFFERLLAAHRRTADAAGIDWESAVFRKISEEVKMDRGLTMKRMLKLAQVSRASYYRFDEEARADHDPEMDLRDAIQRIALEW